VKFRQISQRSALLRSLHLQDAEIQHFLYLDALVIGSCVLDVPCDVFSS